MELSARKEKFNPKQINIKSLKDNLRLLRSQRKTAENKALNKEREYNKINRRLSYEKAIENKEIILINKNELAKSSMLENKKFLMKSKVLKSQNCKKLFDQNQCLRLSIEDGKEKRIIDLNNKRNKQAMISKNEKEKLKKQNLINKIKDKEKKTETVDFIRGERKSAKEIKQKDEYIKKLKREKYLLEQINKEINFKDNAKKVQMEYNKKINEINTYK